MTTVPSRSLPRILRRCALGLLAASLLFLISTWLLLPRWVQGVGARLASEALGREVHMETVRFEPWRLALVVDGLSVAGGQQPLLTVAQIDAALSLRSLWHASPVLSSLRIEQPVLRVARTAEGRYDIDDLLKRLAGDRSKAAAAEPPDWALYNIRVAGGQVLLDDRPLGRRHELKDLVLELPFLSTLDADVKLHVQPRISGRFNGAAFGSEAEALPFAEQAEARLTFKLDGLDVAPYARYLPEALPLRLQRGRVDARLLLQFAQAPKQAPRLQLSGELSLHDFGFQTPAGAPWLSWRELRVGLKDVQPLRRQVQLGAVSWRGAALALNRAALAAGGQKPSDASPQWTFGLESFELLDAALAWQDTAPRAALRADQIALKTGALSWPLRAAAMPLSYGLRLQAPGSNAAPAMIQGEGRLDEKEFALKAQWQDLTLDWFAPYLPAAVSGQAKGRAELSLARPLEADPAARAQLKVSELALRKLALAPSFQLQALTLDELRLDLGARSAQLGTLSLQQAALRLERDAAGAWQLPVMPASEPSDAPPWQAQLRALHLDDGAVQLRDASTGAELAAERIKLRLQDLAWPAKAGATAPVQLSLNIGAPRARRQAASPGSVQWQGHLSLAPLAAGGRLLIDQLPLHAIDPFLDPAWGVQLRRAELGLRADFSAQRHADGSFEAGLSGDLLLADLRLNQARQADGKRVVGETLLSWRTLNLDGIKLALAPGLSPQIEVAAAQLDDFYARLVVDEKGRFNLQDLGPQTAAPAASEPVQAPLRIAVAKTQLSKGRVDFSDHFIRPNYSAQLSELEGTLGAFATGKPDPARLSVKGRVAGTGFLQIDGEMNPGATPLVMDITAAVSDIELAPLSPYAAKYAGYAIERGKLSSRVKYKVDASGALHADNQIMLNQLTFGSKVDSPDATSLPVLFATALLKDRNGMIDIKLPVSGSLNDPDFSIGGLVGKMFLSLLGKALSAPFSLFAGSGAEALGKIAFAPGSAVPEVPLEPIAKALQDRPGLNLSITGWASAGIETAALRERQLEGALQAERRRELRQQQPNAAGAAPFDEADRARLLKRVYEAAPLPDKPKNLLGLLKDLTPAEMRARLLASYAVGEERLRELAVQRGVVVRDALMAQGIPNSRLFLAAPRLQAQDGAADWQAHVELTLGVQ